MDALTEFGREGGRARGAINTGFDPSALNPDFPGHAWLEDRLRWMKRTFGENFDDAPGEVPKDPGQRRNPFPAFHWTNRYQIGGSLLPLDGVQVLTGHDFVVIHEFSVSPPDGADASQAAGGKTRFAAPPHSAALFTAAFDQLTRFASEPLGPGNGEEAARIFNQKTNEVAFDPGPPISADGWAEREFAAGRCPGVRAALRCAVRDSGRRYRGRILVEGPDSTAGAGAADEARFYVLEHIKASAYLTFYCTLLVNDSKAQYECRVADRTFASLKHSLDIRSQDAKGLLRAWTAPGQKSFPAESIGALSSAHLADAEMLGRFDQLIRTCQRNSEQFEQVARQLMESDNLWSADVRRRMSKDNADLLAEQQDLQARLETTKSYLEELRQMSAGAAKSSATAGAADAELVDLRKLLMEQLRLCNDSCLSSASFRLFDPSHEAWEELFEHEIHIPVKSKRDFRSFIIVLYWVFDESVPLDLRRWKRGQPLPDPLTKVAEVLHGETFGQLTVFRNKFGAHDARRDNAASAATKLSQVYYNLVGDRSVERFDATKWLELQKAVLRMLSSVLEQVIQIFGDYQNSASERHGGVQRYGA
ncbi:MAG: hypothetical protein M3444_01975 [Acidobacteriota bacterium]|nr:hypothetical protein [Acidobacteriota bacterium]MDQ5835252.1 hypothetical protein [Acidobacteriota bacterium]